MLAEGRSWSRVKRGKGKEKLVTRTHNGKRKKELKEARKKLKNFLFT